MAEETFDLQVRSREGVVYHDQVVSLSSYNDKGKFDILAQHANFISLISRELVIKDTKGKRKKINLSNALLRVKDARVEVYIGVEGLRSLFVSDEPDS